MNLNPIEKRSLCPHMVTISAFLRLKFDTPKFPKGFIFQQNVQLGFIYLFIYFLNEE